jgi:foldase protein PrsA
MKNVKKIISAALITMVATSLIGCNMIEKTPEGVAKSVVAKVFDAKITRGQVDAQLVPVIKQMETQYGPNYKDNAEAMEQVKAQKDQVLQAMIAEKIVAHKAEELKLVPTEAKLKEVVDKQLGEIKKQLGTDDKYKEALKQAGLTEEALKEKIKSNVVQEAVYTEITKNVKVDEAKQKAYYTSNLTQYTEKPNKIHAAHILVKTEEEALAIKKRLDKGETFAALAKEKGTDGTKDKGGDLDWIDYNTDKMDKTFMAAAITIPVGKVSAPVKTQFGWHLIKAIEKQEFPVKKFEVVKAEIEKNLIAQEKGKIWEESMKKWQEEAKIKKYEKNL